MRALLASPAAKVFALAVVLAFGLLGSRGLWDPDEGRYTNVALNMLESGDWLHPMRSDTVGHWTKPPLTYWAIAVSVGLFGYHEWAARLPMALAFLACVWLTGRIARRLAPGSETTARVVYATMGLTAGAAQWINADYLLAASTTLALWGYVEARFGPGPGKKRWILLMWIGFGLGFLTKGPPALLPLLAVIALQWRWPAASSARPRILWLPALAAFVGIAFGWFGIVTLERPELLPHFLGREVIDRIASTSMNRNPQWYGWLTVYVPTLLLGTLPWTGDLWRWGRRLPDRLKRWRLAPATSQGDSAVIFVALWIALPLLVFCLAKSRLPLYLLPLFTPLAVQVAMQRKQDGRGLPRARWMLLWIVLLLGLRVIAAGWPTHKDASAWADAIRARVDGPIPEVVFVDDMARYGVHLYLRANIEKLSLAPQSPGFDAAADYDLSHELAQAEANVVYVTKQSHWPNVERALRRLGYVGVVRGAPFEQRVIFIVRRQLPQARPLENADRATSRDAGPWPRQLFFSSRSRSCLS